MVEVALANGAGAARLVDDATVLDVDWLAGVTTVGLSSGASVPEVLVGDVLNWLAERGFDQVEEVDTAEERLAFALPRELRSR
jgi:4-hydroxy-3-methylbut-2-enyl diphosphate reductase